MKRGGNRAKKENPIQKSPKNAESKTHFIPVSSWSIFFTAQKCRANLFHTSEGENDNPNQEEEEEARPGECQWAPGERFIETTVDSDLDTERVAREILVTVVALLGILLI